MPLLGVIPARLASSRLPRKPLLPLGGEPLILRVARRLAALSLCDRMVVATDAREIADVVAAAGYEAVMTAAGHQSGTERVAEVARQPAFRAYDVIVNVQGDEPFVPVAAVRGAVASVSAGTPIGTAAAPLAAALAGDPARVKVVVDGRGRAVYFSRAPIPFDRDGRGAVAYRQHIGVYAYARDALERWVRLAPVPEEAWERLEQLRPLLHGIAIGVALLDEAAQPGIDTPADLAWAEAHVTHQLKEVSR